MQFSKHWVTVKMINICLQKFLNLEIVLPSNKDSRIYSHTPASEELTSGLKSNSIRIQAFIVVAIRSTELYEIKSDTMTWSKSTGNKLRPSCSPHFVWLARSPGQLVFTGFWANRDRMLQEKWVRKTDNQIFQPHFFLTKVLCRWHRPRNTGQNTRPRWPIRTQC